MKRRFLGITSLLFASVMISGCSNLLDDGTVKVLSNDVKAETMLQESELKVMKKDRLPITETVEYNGLAHQSLFFNENGATYRVNPITNEKEKIADIEFYEISQHGNKALAKAGQTFSVLDSHEE